MSAPGPPRARQSEHPPAAEPGSGARRSPRGAGSGTAGRLLYPGSPTPDCCCLARRGSQGTSSNCSSGMFWCHSCRISPFGPERGFGDSHPSGSILAYAFLACTTCVQASIALPTCKKVVPGTSPAGRWPGKCATRWPGKEPGRAWQPPPKIRFLFPERGCLCRHLAPVPVPAELALSGCD